MNSKETKSLKDKSEEFKLEGGVRSTDLEQKKRDLDLINSHIKHSTSDWEESKSLLETLFRAVPDHVAMIDLNRNVVFSNAEEYSEGGNCYKLFFDRETPCQNCRLEQVKEKKAPVTTEIEHKNQYFEVQSIPVFNKAAEVKGVVEYYRDVTKEKEIEQQLEQAGKLASLGQLVSGIGHEINNPNQFIKGNISIVKQALEDMLPIVDEYAKTKKDFKVANLPYEFLREQILVLVDDMARGSQRIKNIVASLKRFSRHDEGLLTEDVDINAVITESCRLVQNQVGQSAVIHMNLGSNLPTFRGNTQKIEQVMINLIINASEAMPKDGRGDIWIKTYSEEDSDQDNVVIEVKDNGSGMNDTTLKHLFEPFFTTKRGQGGTGIGLSIVFQVIEEHKGKIKVDSKPGMGTTFRIILPSQKFSNGN